MDYDVGREMHVGAEAAALLAIGNADVVVAEGPQWKPAKHHVSVGAAANTPIFPESKLVSKLLGEVTPLV
jgi:hypothetical protein